LSKAPEATVILDSRGLVFLRLGRLDEAITDFNRALAKNPNQPYSLFGRAVAWAGKGEKSKSDAAAAAADKIDPNVRADFEGYGVKL
jgi:tetratricopeptide (TPR) repeat protein